MERPWFEHVNCDLLKVEQSIPDKKITHSVTIEDQDFIKNLMSRISTIPANGDLMISFAPTVQKTNLAFHCGNKIQTIEIYGQRFKTPSTGFNAEKNEIEEKLCQDIDALLLPDFNKIIPKVKNLVLPFESFSIIYKGSEFKDYHPVTISVSIEKFLIIDLNKNEHLIQIEAGQIPPQPQRIKVNQNKFSLLTYETKNHVGLYPHYFQITNQGIKGYLKRAALHFYQIARAIHPTR